MQTHQGIGKLSNDKLLCAYAEPDFITVDKG